MRIEIWTKWAQKVIKYFASVDGRIIAWDIIATSAGSVKALVIDHSRHVGGNFRYLASFQILPGTL